MSRAQIYNYRGYAYEFLNADNQRCQISTSHGIIGAIAKFGNPGSYYWKIARRKGDEKPRRGYDTKRAAAEAVIDEHSARGIEI